MVERTGFVVYYKNAKIVEVISELVNVTYVSKKNNYLFAYCDTKRFKGIKKTLLETKGVKGVDVSRLDNEQFTFDNEIETVK